MNDNISDREFALRAQRTFAKRNADKAAVNANFERNQADLTLTDVKVQWLASCVRLYIAGQSRDLTVLTVDGRIQDKIKGWCVKNNYRCSQVRNNRIYL